jgi:hypothetical protein
LIRLPFLLRLLVLGLAGSLALLCLTNRARAQPAGLPAVIDVGGSELDAAEVKSAIERELGVKLVIDAAAQERLEVTTTGRRANVTYYAPEREPVTRSVDLPHDHERALETIAFLAGNLARDEASELLAQLAPPPGTEPDSVPRPEEPPAPKPEAPKPPPPAPPAPKPAEPALIEPKHFAANASFYYPLTALKHTEQRRLNLEIGIAYSHIGALHGIGGTLGYFRSDGLVEGFSAALGWNRSGPVKGLQFGGLVNEGYGELHGISFASLVNTRDGDTNGIQGGLLFAKTHLILGTQASAIAAVATEVQGIQVGVIVAVAGPVQGGQIGLVNVAGPVEGMQFGLVNTSGPVQGTQIGLVNTGGKVYGFQFGLVNVADEIHGGALGLVSVAKNGRLQPATWFSGPNETFLLGLKSVTDWTYTQFGVGYGLSSVSDPTAANGQYHRVTWQGTFGAHFDLGNHLYGEAGIGYGEWYKEHANSPLLRSEVRLDARVGFEPVYGLTPFIGGGLAQRITGKGWSGPDLRGEYFLGVSVL